MRVSWFTLMCLLLLSSVALAQKRPTHIYVPNAEGDVSEAQGQAIASEVSALLAEKGLEALTLANLKAQLKEQQYKELLGCDKKKGCVEERIDSFGYADRLFVHVMHLEPQIWQLEVSHFVQGKLRRGGKLSARVQGDSSVLGGAAAEMALRLLDLSVPGESKTPAEKWTPDMGDPWSNPR